MGNLLSFFSCPICGTFLTKPAPPCPQCELMESAKARGLEIGPWPPNNPGQVETYVEPPRYETQLPPPPEDNLIHSFEGLFNVAWAAYGPPVLGWADQLDEKEIIYLKVALVVIELEKRKRLAKEKVDYHGLIRLRYEHNYLDMRLIIWENGGPDPFKELPEEGLDSLGRVIESLSEIFEFINFSSTPKTK